MEGYTCMINISEFALCTGTSTDRSMEYLKYMDTFTCM